MPRAARVLAAGFVLAVALPGLAACRSSPDVAAYVGDETITVDELQDAVDAHRADPSVKAGKDPEYTRAILNELVRTEVYDSAAEHFGVDPHQDDMPQLLESLLGGQDPNAYVQQAASRGYTRADTMERVRQVGILRDIAVAKGKAEEPTDAGLRAAYEQGLAAQPKQAEIGLVDVPDQAAADAAVKALQADPAAYPTVAAAHAGQWTLPTTRSTALDDLAKEAPQLAAQVEATPPGGVFDTTVEGIPGVLVVLVAGVTVPSFEESRPTLEATALQNALAAGSTILDGYQKDLDIDVNPRYGVLKDGSIAEPEGGVVQLLGTKG